MDNIKKHEKKYFHINKDKIKGTFLFLGACYIFWGLIYFILSTMIYLKENHYVIWKSLPIAGNWFIVIPYLAGLVFCMFFPFYLLKYCFD